MRNNLLAVASLVVVTCIAWSSVEATDVSQITDSKIYIALRACVQSKAAEFYQPSRSIPQIQIVTFAACSSQFAAFREMVKAHLTTEESDLVLEQVMQQMSTDVAGTVADTYLKSIGRP